MITGTGAILFFTCLFISRFLEERVEVLLEEGLEEMLPDDPYFWSDFFALGRNLGFVIMLVGFIMWFFKELP